MPSTGIQQIEETIVAAMGIVTAATTVGRDGWQLTDAGLLIENPTLRAAIVKALEGADQIPAEVKDLDFAEIMQLAQSSLSAVKNLGAKVITKR